MPAILGMHRNADIMADIENQLGCKVFEIPTMPPSMAGLRIKEKIETHLTRQGVLLFSQKLAIPTAWGTVKGYLENVKN
jgi:glycerol-3-phosphate dehydrogenase subunit B